MSRLEQLSERNPADVPVLTTGMTYNPASQIRTLTRSNDNYAFTGHANGSDQLDYNRLNQLLDIDPSAGDPVPVTHNARGDITVIGSGPGAANYGYTSESLMTSAPDGVAMAYDPLMRLYEVVDPSALSENTDRFAYDGATMIAEYGGANNLRRRWVHGPGVDEPLVWIEGTGTPADRRWLHADERGSIIAVSNASGQVTDINRYDEYGNPQGGSIVGRFGYTGQAWLPELGPSTGSGRGMYYYRARIYNPAIQRFMQPDPIRYGDGLNLYSYVGGDPINLIDPTGQTPANADEKKDLRCIGNVCGISAGTGSRVPGRCVGCSFFGNLVVEVRDTWSRHGADKAVISKGWGPWQPVGDTSQLSYANVQWLVSMFNLSGAPDEVVIALMWKESKFRPADRSDDPDSTAFGLMQMTRTAVAEVNRIHDTDFRHDRMSNPVVNTLAGTMYLAITIDRMGGDLLQGLNYYGTGPGYGDAILRAAHRLNFGFPMTVLRTEIGR